RARGKSWSAPVSACRRSALRRRRATYVPQRNGTPRCEAPVGGRHIGSGRCTTLPGRGSGSRATLAPARRLHLSIRVRGSAAPFAVGDLARDEGEANRAGGAGARGTAV